jgi:hypothetical protein
MCRPYIDTNNPQGMQLGRFKNRTPARFEYIYCTLFPLSHSNYSCFEIDQEMDAIFINYQHFLGVCRIVVKSVQQCIYFLFSVLITDKEPCKFAFNKRQNTNYSFLSVTSKVSCIRKKRGQIICMQGNN